MEFDHRTQRAATSAAAGHGETMPGKRTLTEGLVEERREDATELAERETAASPPAPLPAAGNTRPTLQMLFGVQRVATTGADDPAQVHAAAAHGTATPATPLPYADQIQRAFGRHDISGIQAHTGPAAAASARAMGAAAYATGNHVVLGGGTDLHTVAHEAAHVVQQRGGVQLKGGVGEVGDAYEQHADQVADAVVQGKSAEGLLDRYAGGGGPAQAAGLQRKTLAGQAAALADAAAGAVSPVPPRGSGAVIQRVQVTWKADIESVVNAAAMGGQKGSSVSSDPFAALMSQSLGVDGKKQALLVKVKAQSEAEFGIMVDELKQLGKLGDVKGLLGREFEDLLALHAQGPGARDYHALLKRYETADPADALERNGVVDAVTRLGDEQRRNLARQLVLVQKTWATLSPRLGPAFDALIATEIYNSMLRKYEGAAVAVEASEQKDVVARLTGIGDFALHRVLDLLRTTKVAKAPEIATALGAEFETLLGTKLAVRTVETFNASGKGAATTFIGQMSAVELRAFARYVIEKKGGQKLNDALGPAAHDAVVGKELEARFKNAMVEEFLSSDDTARALSIIQGLSAYELGAMLTQMRASDKDQRHSLDRPGAKSKELVQAVGGNLYDTSLKHFADGATPTTLEKDTVNAQLGTLHGFELATLTAKIRAENKPATLITKFGDAFKAIYHEGLRQLFDRATDLAVLSRLIQDRFGIEFGEDTGVSGTGVAWDKKGLAQAWDVLERLPPSQVVGNDKLVKFLRYDVADASDLLGLNERGASGAHAGDKATLGYDTRIIDSAKNQAAKVGDPLLNVNRFDKVVRHEVGHAVDAKHNLSDTYCIDNAAGGNWKKHADMTALARLFVEQAPSNAVIRSWGNPTQKTKIIAKLAEILGDENSRAAVDTRLDELGSDPNKLSLSQIAQVKGDGGVEAIRVAMAKGSPWYAHATGGVPLANGRIYVQSYGDKRAGDWVSYDAAARGKSLSTYQFRSPGEWFAEAYACYYEPGAATGAHLGRKEATNQANGALLDARDPTTKAWFDGNVATK